MLVLCFSQPGPSIRTLRLVLSLKTGQDFYVGGGATAWLRLDECAAGQPADRLACTAGTRSPEATTQDTLLLGIERDALGMITALEQVEQSMSNAPVMDLQTTVD